MVRDELFKWHQGVVQVVNAALLGMEMDGIYVDEVELLEGVDELGEDVVFLPAVGEDIGVLPGVVVF